MELLFYNELNKQKVKAQFDKTIAFLKNGDFKSADVKKMPNTGYYRAKLDDTNRLIFKIGEYKGKKYLFILEVILNHEYEKSRFLNGAQINDQKLAAVINETEFSPDDFQKIGYINDKNKNFYLLDKILSFDEIQSEVIALPAPCIIIGSAGSGKTAITLEKLKKLSGKILYVTLSSYLTENASLLYSSYEYENDLQEVSFLSFYEYLSSIQLPAGKEVDFKNFSQWITKYKQTFKIRDANKVYEEFKGVLTGAVTEQPYLSREDYLSLGIKQSIYSQNERAGIYELFEKYLQWLKEGNYFDSNIFSYNILEKINAAYDYIVVDEVQDITNVQLLTILKSLKDPANFVLCGDSNQIVHPNFFSWSQVKSLFYKQDVKRDIIRILETNYRNTLAVTKLANQLLIIKNARFGSIDKESTYLVKANSQNEGVVEFLENNNATKNDLNKKTKNSANFAVLVLRNEDKPEAKAFFNTPLLFSIQEAKGLEYENIILYNIISGSEKEFRAVTQGVTKDELHEDTFKFGRNKDKTDRSLDEYKFYVNSLYVGITRAVKNLYILETNKKHELLALLDLIDFKTNTSLNEQKSSHEEWQKEASRLEKQGKAEQAEAIRQQVLQTKPVPWVPLTVERLESLITDALRPEHYNKKAKDKLYDYGVTYSELNYLHTLSFLKYSPADKWLIDKTSALNKLYPEYAQDNLKLLLPKIKLYGINFPNEENLTPFIIAIITGAKQISDYLIENGAKTNVTDIFGRSPFQLAILHTYINNKQKNKILSNAYPLLKNESIKLKYENKLIKIDSHQGEFWMVHFMLAILRSKIIGTTKNTDSFVFTSNTFFRFFSDLTNHIQPDYRKKKTYISSLLAQSEVSKDDKYNKKLFQRIALGNYILNPGLEIFAKDQWLSIIDFVQFDQIVKVNKGFEYKWYYEACSGNKKEKVEQVS